MEEREHLLDLVDQLEREVLGLDQSGDTTAVHLLFRTVHNLKSTTAYVGLAEAAQCFHELEDGLDRIRRGRQCWESTWSDRILKGVDLMRHLLDSATVERKAPVEPAPVHARGAWGLSLDQEEQERLSMAMLNGRGIYRIEKLFRKGISRPIFETLPVMTSIQEVGELIAYRPTWEVFEKGPEEQVFQFLFASCQTYRELAEVFFDPLMELQAPSLQTMSANTLRSLVIDDELTTRLVLEEALLSHGTCASAATAREGFALFREAWERKAPFHLLILDLMLPDLNGNAVLKALRQFEAEQHVPLEARCIVIVNTASEEMKDLHTSLALGADGYLLKPISMIQIDEKLAAVRERMKL